MRLATLLAAVLLTSTTSWAQVDAGTITGTVHDATGAVIPGASITIVNEGTGQQIATESGAQGIYVSPPLRPGAYRVEARADGFEPAGKRFTLDVNQRAAIDFNLAVGAVAETVEVVDVIPVLQTESATLSDLRTEKEIKDLPLNGRNWAQLVQLGAGVMPAQTQQAGSPTTMKRGPTGNAVNGMRLEENNYLVDGISNAENHNGLGVMIFPSVDAIQEFRTEASGADAQFGRGGGATVNLTYKSGTQEFHGGLFEYLRNEKLDAKNFFDSADEPIPPYKQNQFGAFVGGPINPAASNKKTFFFALYEGSRIRQAQTLISTVPSEAFKQGDFALARNRIFDPLTQRSQGGQTVRDPFPNNAVPRARQDQVGINLLNLYPSPNRGAAETNNYLGNPVRSINGDKFDAKVDHIFGASNNMFVRYSHHDDDLIEPAFLPGVAVGNGPGVPGPADQPVNQIVLSDTHLVSPTKINEFRAGWTRLNLRAFNPEYGQNVSSEIGVPGANVEGDILTSGLSIFNLGGFRALGSNGFSPAIIVSDNIQLSDSFTVISGRHSLKFGGEFRRLRYNTLQSNLLRGTMTFSGDFTVNPASRTNTGHGGADALLGKPISGQIRFINGTRGFRRSEVGMHFQDVWKATDRLTLTLGLRYDNFMGWPWVEVADRMYQFVEDLGTVVQVGTGEVPWRSGIPGDNNNFSPRLGIAYRLNQKTVVRTAYGMFYSAPQLDTTRNIAANPPEFITSNFNNNLFDFAGARPASQGFDRPPQGTITGTLRAIDPTARMPYTQQWNFSLQRELPGSVSLTLAYVGTAGRKLTGHTDINQPLPGTGPVAARRAFPAFGEIRSYQTRHNSSYHGLQITGEKRFARGLSFLAAYTWSKNIDTSTGQFGTPQDIRNIGRDRGLSGTSAPRRLTTSFVYELPFKVQGPANVFIGGWQLNGILSLYDGLPISVTSPNTTNCCSSYADRLADGRLPSDEQTLDRWFDVDAFARPGPGLFGNGGRNILFGPGTRNLDFSVFKNFQFSEDGRRRLQFRAEFFNLTNTPQFNNPNTNIGSADVATINSAGSPLTLQRIPRHIQLALKFYF